MNDSKRFIQELAKISSILSFYCFGFSGLFEVHALIYPGILFSLPYILSKKKLYLKNYNRYYFLFTIPLILGCLLNLLNTSNNLGGLFVLIANLALAIFIIQNIQEIYLHTTIFIITCIVYISYKLFYLDIPPHEFYENFSRNIPGYFLVIWCVFFLFVSRLNSKKTPLIIPISAFIISIFLIGRSSLGVLLVISIITIFQYIKNKSRIISVTILILFSVLVAQLVKNIEVISLFLDTGFAKKGIESQRFDIWKSYLHNMSYIDLITGRDPYKIPLIEMYDGVLHNSFLKFHSRMGFAFFSFMGFYCMSLIYYIKRGDYYLFVLLVLLSVRIFFDSMNFISPLDFIFFSITLYPLKNKSINL